MSNIVSNAIYDAENFVVEQEFGICHSITIESGKNWEQYFFTLSELCEFLTSHKEVEEKEYCHPFFPGVLTDGNRNNLAVEEIHLMGFDLDNGSPIEPAINRIQELGLHAIIYSTHSHLTTTSKIKLSNYMAKIGNTAPCEEGIRKYLGTFKDWTPDLVETASIQEVGDDLIIVTHDPIPKYRIVLPMVEPFRVSDYHPQGDVKPHQRIRPAQQMWEAVYAAVASHLGLAFDETCTDLSRAFFLPSVRPGAERFAKIIEGKLLDLKDYPVDPAKLSPKLPAKRTTASKATRASSSQASSSTGKTDKATNLRKLKLAFERWLGKYGKTFNIEDALRTYAPAEIFGSPRSSGQPGVHITCPFEETHTEPGGSGTFVVNASENGDIGLGIHCCHAHCLGDRGDGHRVDRAVFIIRMAELGWLPAKALRAPEFGGGPLGKIQPRTDFLVIDANNVGLDAEKFHANVIQQGLLDFTKLNANTPEPLPETCTPDDLADFIELRWITVALLRSVIKDTEPEGLGSDYEKDVYRLARSIRIDNPSKLEIEQAIDKIVRLYDGKIKIVKRDLESMEDRFAVLSDGHLGIMPWYEVRKKHEVSKYTQKYARLLQSGKLYILDMEEENLSSALFAGKDFKEYAMHDYFDYSDRDGRKKTYYPGSVFVDKPPVCTQVFDKGLVFKPAGIVLPGQWNLFKGFGRQPDSSGSCSLLYELLETVWCDGDLELFLFVREWLMHILAFPENKVGNALIVRGDQGEGKSIVFDEVMRPLLGPTILKVTNDNLVLGDFNEALIGRLLVVFEEAAFAGDKKKFEGLKELITNSTAAINAKYKPIAVVDNHARIALVTNNDHAGHVQSHDRRYTVIETNSSWVGTNKFEAFVDQMRNGGVERFFYEAMNHTFRTQEGSQRLVIEKPIMTDAKAEQMDLSRSPLDSYIADVIVSGRLTTGLSASHPAYDCFPRWDIDDSYPISGASLKALAQSYIEENCRFSREKITVSSVLKRFEKYLGELPVQRRKITGPDGKRQDAPIERVLPPRRKALEAANKKKLLTRYEYEEAMPPAVQVGNNEIVKRFKS